MANSDDDDDFRDLYKEYKGPLGCKALDEAENVEANKRSRENSDEEEETRDPNAVPTDFTSREAKLWEAKSKATERNWKKRKEQEFICKICGDSGHFTQGCPTTLGASRKSQDFFERVPAREKHVKDLFTDKVVQKIEKDIGCKIKIEEKFIIVSGKDRLILKKGVDAVHKVKEDGEKKESSGSHKSRSRSPPPERSPVVSRSGRSDTQKSLPSPRNAPQFQPRFNRQDRVVEDRVRGDLQKMARVSPSGRNSIGYIYGVDLKQEIYLLKHAETGLPPRGFTERFKIDCVVKAAIYAHLKSNYLTCSSFGEAYGNDGARGRPSRSKSPARHPYATGEAYGNDGARGHPSRSKSPARHPYTAGNFNNSFDGHGQTLGAYRTDGRDSERRRLDLQFGLNSERPVFLQTLEEVELEYKREAAELGRIRDKEEDEENTRHREAVRDIRESYTKKLAMLRGSHGKQWDDFLHLDVQRRQQQAHPRQQLSASEGFVGYKQPFGYPHPEYDNPASRNPGHYGGASMMPMDPRGEFPNSVDDRYGSSRHHDSFGDFPRQRREEYGKAYNRF